MFCDLEKELLKAKDLADELLADSPVKKILVFTISEIRKVWPTWRMERYRDSELYLHANIFVKEAIKLTIDNASSSDILDFQTRFYGYLKEAKRKFPSNFSIKQYAYIDYKKSKLL
ncbi:MAG TPA: hypothetical protein VES38_02015 [Methylotenera sp.]|nr:hypothetical protein [Methylotenera sp.]